MGQSPGAWWMANSDLGGRGVLVVIGGAVTIVCAGGGVGNGAGCTVVVVVDGTIAGSVVDGQSGVDGMEVRTNATFRPVVGPGRNVRIISNPTNTTVPVTNFHDAVLLITETMLLKLRR